jgi:hypothetical protein
MANLVYRETDIPETRTDSSVKGTFLSNAEVDSNFILINEQLESIKTGVGIDDESITRDKLEDMVTVLPAAYGSEAKIPKITVNNKGLIEEVEEIDIIRNVYQVKSASYLLTTDLTTIIPLDNSIPQITEGAQIFSVSITPISMANKLILDISGCVTATADCNLIVSIFRDNTADAIAANLVSLTANKITNLNFSVELPIESTNIQDYKVRVGTNTNTTIRFNSSLYLGGLIKTSMTLSEVKI